METLDFDPEKRKALRARLAREKKGEKKKETLQEESKEVHQDDFSSAFHQASQAGSPASMVGQKETLREPLKTRNQSQPEEEGLGIPLYLLYLIGGLVLFLIGLLIASFFFQEAPVIIY